MRARVWLVGLMSMFLLGCPRSGESVDIGGLMDTQTGDRATIDGGGTEDAAMADLAATELPLNDVIDPVDVVPADLLVDEIFVDVSDVAADIPCAPDCEGKECGPDGCGGTCGTCPEIAPVCDGDGLCQFDCPAPDCDTEGARQCVGETTYQTCSKPEAPCEGSLYWSEAKDCLEGTLCVDGECLATDPCEQAAVDGSHFGCAFWSVDLAVYADPYVDPTPDLSPHALHLVAPPGETATVTFQTIAQDLVLETTELSLCGGCSSALTLPVMSLSGAGIFDRSIHIVSDRPISVAQVNPESVDSTVSDASLLWPEHLLDTDYRVFTWPTQPLEQAPIPGFVSQHGYFAVVATSPGVTSVDFTLPVNGKALPPGGEALGPGELHTVSLAQHEVLQVLADGAVLAESYDLTGAVLAADHPVAVFGGHEEAVVCWEGVSETCCADHMEAQLLPESQWGHHHICVKAPPRSGMDQDVWRVAAGNAGANLTTSPTVGGLHGVELGPNEWVEVVTETDFELFSDQPVQVMQYLVGKECSGGSTGDPAMVNNLPKTAFTTDFHAPVLPGYLSTTAVVIRVAGKTSAFAGSEVTQPFEPIGQGTYERAYVPLPDSGWFAIPDGGMVYLYGFATVSAYGLPLGAQHQPFK